MTQERGDRGGFSLVELVIALVILTMGMLAMAAGSSFSSIEVRGSGIRSQRTAAVAAMIEQIRAQAYTVNGFDNIPALPKTSAKLYGSMSVWYDTATAPDSRMVNANGLKRFTIWTQGPTYVTGKGWVKSSQEGVVFDLYRPVR